MSVLLLAKSPLYDQESKARKAIAKHGVALCSDLVRLLAIEEYGGRTGRAITCFDN